MTETIKFDLAKNYQTVVIRGQLDTRGPDCVGPIFEVRFLVAEGVYLYSDEFEHQAWKALEKAKHQLMTTMPHSMHHVILEIASVSSDYIGWKIHSRSVESK